MAVTGKLSLAEVMDGHDHRRVGDVLRRQEEEELVQAAIDRLPTYDRVRKGLLGNVLDSGRVMYEGVDVTMAKLRMHDKKQLMDSILKAAEPDNDNFLRRLGARTDR